MNEMTDHQELRDSIPAYALGILDIDEAEALSGHIASCVVCQAELQAMLQTVNHLGHGAPDAQPRLELKDRVFSQIRLEAPADSGVKSTWWDRLFGPKPALSWISVGLIIVLAVSNLLLWNQVRGMKGTPFESVQLLATDAMPEAKGMIVVSEDGRYGTLVASDLEPLSEAQQYQLWLIKAGERTNGGVFSVSESGYAAFQVYSYEPLSDFDSFGITIEPYGGSPGPTGEKILGSK